MNRSLLAVGGAAAVVVVALALGMPRAGQGPTVGAQQPSSPPSATPAPSLRSVAPSAAPSGLAVGERPAGPHQMLIEGVTLTVDIPGPRWFGDPSGGILVKNDEAGAPEGIGLIVFAEDLFVYGDPCKWSTTKPDELVATVDAAVAALSAQLTRDASTPKDITVDGHAGKSVILRVPEDAKFGDCDEGKFASWGTASESAARYHQDPGQIDELWILDVDGTLVVMDGAYYEGTPPEDVAELRAILQSATFE